MRQKLSDPDAVLVTVRRAGQVVGMALAERFRSLYGEGDVEPGRAHVSMVFVHPDHQRQGLGSALVEQIAAAIPGFVLSLWTRDSNDAARALYTATEFAPTRDVGQNPHGATLTRWERPAGFTR